MAGRLTTHVLDTMHGRPAQGVAIELTRIEEEGRAHLKRVMTNADGRCDEPLLAGDALACGTYELIFHIGAYFRATGATMPSPCFLERVPVRFGVADAGAHYHVPLLVSPWSYTTYRGS